MTEKINISKIELLLSRLFIVQINDREIYFFYQKE